MISCEVGFRYSACGHVIADGSETASSSNLTSLKESGLSLSLASLYSGTSLVAQLMPTCLGSSLCSRGLRR